MSDDATHATGAEERRWSVALLQEAAWCTHDPEYSDETRRALKATLLACAKAIAAGQHLPQVIRGK